MAYDPLDSDSNAIAPDSQHDSTILVSPRERMQQMGYDPLIELVEIAREARTPTDIDEKPNLELAFKVNKELLKYVSPSLQAIQLHKHQQTVINLETSNWDNERARYNQYVLEEQSQREEDVRQELNGLLDDAIEADYRYVDNNLDDEDTTSDG